MERAVIRPFCVEELVSHIDILPSSSGAMSLSAVPLELKSIPTPVAS